VDITAIPGLLAGRSGHRVHRPWVTVASQDVVVSQDMVVPAGATHRSGRISVEPIRCGSHERGDAAKAPWLAAFSSVDRVILIG
jgi:hypothetical protein